MADGEGAGFNLEKQKGHVLGIPGAGVRVTHCHGAYLGSIFSGEGHAVDLGVLRAVAVENGVGKSLGVARRGLATGHFYHPGRRDGVSLHRRLCLADFRRECEHVARPELRSGQIDHGFQRGCAVP